MNDASANLPALEPLPPGKSWSDGPPPDEGWSLKKILFLIVLAAIVHLALIVAFGTKKQYAARPVTHVPQLQLANHVDRQMDELLALDNPALFALPNPHDFASVVWQKSPRITPPPFRWQATPGELAQPDPDKLGAAFSHFIQTNQFGHFQLNFKPSPLFAELVSPADSSSPQQSTLQVSGALAERPVLAQPALPSIAFADVIAPSKVRVTVDKTGTVISAVLLPSDNPLEAAGRSPSGDTNAVVLARSVKFAPAPQMALGEIIFYWHTTPPLSTNSPAIPPVSP